MFESSKIALKLIIWKFSESLLELIIAKDSLKSNSPSIDQVLAHPFFKESTASFDQTYSESLAASKFSLTAPCKDSLMKAFQKAEQRLKDEQKLVKSQKRVVRVYGSEEEKKKQTKQKVMWIW